jgi:hypothetical protein
MGGFVGNAGNYSAAMDRDASESDEQPCATVRLQ